MARSHPESRTVAFAESGSDPSSGPPDIAPSGPPGAATQRGTRGPARTRLVWAALALGACVIAAFVIAALGVGYGRAFAVAGVAAALLLAGVLSVLYRRYEATYRRYDAALAAAAARYNTAKAAIAGWERGDEDRRERESKLQRQTRELERRSDEYEAHYRSMTAGVLTTLGELLEVQVPAALAGSAVPGFSASAAGNGEVGDLCGRIADAVAKGVAELREQHEDKVESFRLAVLKLARQLQDSAWRIQAEAAEMEQSHQTEPDVLEAALRVDHAAAQQARHATSVVVLCGEWPGRQWPKPLALLDVVRAAASRIVPYERVKVMGDPTIAAAASINEPLIHLVAELLANATQSSPPATDVEVTVRSVQRGAVIQVDDGGVGMNEAQFDQAREIASGRRTIGLGDLGEIAQTGLAVIGHYVNRHGFKVNLAESPYEGVRATVLVPVDKVETLDPAEALSPPSLPLPAQSAAPESGGAGTRHLPQRHHRRGQAQPASPPPPEQPPSAERTPAEEGRLLDAFLSAGAAADNPDADAAPPKTGESTGSPDVTETE